MGACLTQARPNNAANNERTVGPPVTFGVKTSGSLKEHNPEISLESPTKQSSYPTAISGGSQVQTDIKIKSVVSLEDAFQKSKVDVGEEEQDLEQWLQEHNIPSSIIALSKSKKIPGKNQQSPIKKKGKVVSQLEDCQDMLGNFRTQRREARMMISTDVLDIQFMLPRTRAGPLVVPYIGFEKYNICEKSK